MVNIDADIVNTQGRPRDAGLVAAVNPGGTLIRQNPAFFQGKEFRTFRRIDIPTSTPLVIRAVVPINVILQGLGVSIVSNRLLLETVVGGTPGGVFSENLPIFNRNNMSGTPVYAPQVTLTAGGSHSGGTVLDVIDLLTGSGGNAQTQTVGVSAGDDRGIAPGTYYFRLTATGGNVAGVFSARWEERP